MHHDHVLKKKNLELLTPSIRSGVGGGGVAGKIFATILLHFVILFDLMCNMTMFWKS